MWKPVPHIQLVLRSWIGRLFDWMVETFSHCQVRKHVSMLLPPPSNLQRIPTPCRLPPHPRAGVLHVGDRCDHGVKGYTGVTDFQNKSDRHNITAHLFTAFYSERYKIDFCSHLLHAHHLIFTCELIHIHIFTCLLWVTRRLGQDSAVSRLLMKVTV